MKEITLDKENSRFVLTVDGVEVGFAEFVETGKARDFVHTEVYPDYRGQGLSKPLLEAAVGRSKAEGYDIIPTCSAVAAYLAQMT